MNAPPSPAVVRLRPHHLLCILTFVGEGYSAAFVANYRAIVARIGAGVPIVLVDGPDDVCAPLCGTEPGHCTNESVTRSDAAARRALADVRELQPLLHDGARYTLGAALIADLRARFARGEIRAACAGCEWSALCTSIAADRFSATLL